MAQSRAWHTPTLPTRLLFPHRGVLALQAGAVESQCSDAGRAAWDVEKALISSLA